MTETTTESPTAVKTGSAVEHSDEPSLELRHLHRFFGRLKAVDDVSFRAYPGQVIGYIGPNGAGKTTSMRILSTLDVPTAGDAFVCGYSVVDDPDKVRRHLGFMPDSFGRYPNMNVVEYLDFTRAPTVCAAPDVAMPSSTCWFLPNCENWPTKPSIHCQREWPSAWVWVAAWCTTRR